MLPTLLAILLSFVVLYGLTGLDDGSTVETVDQDVAGAITHLHDTKVYSDWLGRPVLIKESDDTPIAACRYNGFGRLAKRIALWPSGKTTQYREEVYYYDGVRRIQEVFTDPIDAIPPWAVDPGDVPLYTGGNSHRTEAEFIWSAASGQPFDTCHVQLDWWDREAWYIQDHATGTVRAFVDANGELVRQQRFDAFGTLRSEDAFALTNSGQLFHGFRQRLGHQGLFAERVDADTLALPLELGGEVWYQSRSRWYVPELGRFLTRDPNQTGIPTQRSLAMLGMMPAGPPSGSFGWEGHYGDGWDTWTAYGANPVLNQDPNGLFVGFLKSIAIRLQLGWRTARAAQAGNALAAEIIGEFAYGGYVIGGGAVAGAGLLDELFGIRKTASEFIQSLGRQQPLSDGKIQLEVAGGAVRAAEDFMELTGEYASASNLRGAVAVTPSGVRYGFHQSSSTQVWTMDINVPGEAIYKVRYLDAWVLP